MPEPRPDSEDTRQLLDRATAGDAAAAGELLARYRPDLVAFADLHLDPAVRGRLDPSDVVQEAQTDLARGLTEFLRRRPVPFHLWARQAVYARLLNARRDHRAARRDVRREAAGPDRSSVVLARAVLDPGPSPSEAAEAAELAARVAAALETLPEADREILLLRQVDRLPYEEVGVLLGIDSAAARKRYGRALVRLERAIGGNLKTGGE